MRTTTPHLDNVCGPSVIIASGVLLSTLAGCGSETGGPPSLTFDVDTCDHCQMLISEPAYAAAYRIGDQELVFDDIGCLVSRLADVPERDRAEIWVHDLEDSEWVPAAAASFIRFPGLTTPMSSGLVALRDPTAAEALAAHRSGQRIRSLRSLIEDPQGVDPRVR